MPTPRQHGGAPTEQIPLTLPGFSGLNTIQKTGILGPEWATYLRNTVIDDNSRVAARAGWDPVTSSTFASTVRQTYSYTATTGAEFIFATTDTDIFKSTDGGVSFSSVKGGLTPVAGNWQFVSFNGACYAAQQGTQLISANTGNFAAVSGAPSGNCVLAAFGRLWAADSTGKLLKYCALLSGATWSTGDSGQLDLTNVWPSDDTIVALAAANGMLVVFGRHNIVIYHDPTGSVVGITPSAATVYDIVPGIGCSARDSVQLVEGDLWFLSDSGLQSLGRLLVQKSNPINNLSKNVNDQLVRMYTNSTPATIRSVYSYRDKFYLLSFPGTTGTGESIVFDTRGKLPDGSARCTGEWTLVPTAMCIRNDGVMLMARTGTTASGSFSSTGFSTTSFSTTSFSLGASSVGVKLGAYRGRTDGGSTYQFDYESAWMDLTRQGYLLIAKRLYGVFFTDNAISVAFKWAFDFKETFYSVSKIVTGGGASAEYGTAEYGTAEYNGGVALSSARVPASHTGEFVKLGVSATINGQQLSLQQLKLLPKIGRMA